MRKRLETELKDKIRVAPLSISVKFQIMLSKRKNKIKRLKTKRLSFLILIVLVPGTVSYIIGFKVASSISNRTIDFSLPLSSDWGTFIGGFASLFAAGISLYATFLLYKTYESQKKELKATNEGIRMQKIDSAFFNMLSMLEKIIQGMSKEMYVPDYSAEEGAQKLKVVTGREYMHEAFRALENIFNANHLTFNVDMNTGEFKGVTNKFKNVNELREFVGESVDILMSKQGHKSNLAHYFRYVFNIIKFIDQNQLGDFETRRYLGILQAQLSHDELGLIFYDSISGRGKKENGEYQFAEWLSRYDILSNIDPDCVFKQFHYWLHPKAKIKFIADSNKLVRELRYDDSLVIERKKYVDEFLK